MKASKKTNIKLFSQDLVNFISKISKECMEFAVVSCFNDKKVMVTFKRNGGKHV